MRQRPSVAGRVAGAVAMLVLAGCGGDGDGDSEEDAIRARVNELSTTNPALCDHMTSRVQRDYFKDVADCKRKMDRDETKRDIRVERVAIDGDKGTARVVVQGKRAEYGFVRQGGDWKIDTFARVRPQPKIREGLSPRETASAYYRAILDGDEAAFCGLLSKTYAKRLVGSASGDVLTDCAESFADYDWERARRRAVGVKVASVVEGPAGTTVTMSNKRRLALIEEDGRWVVDRLTDR